MNPEQKLKTPAEVLEEFVNNGQSIAEWARKHGLNPKRVYEVLQQRNKGVRGEAHKAAVLLGIKNGNIDNII